MSSSITIDIFTIITTILSIQPHAAEVWSNSTCDSMVNRLCVDTLCCIALIAFNGVFALCCIVIVDYFERLIFKILWSYVGECDGFSLARHFGPHA
jgi:hypothetical protein